MTRILETSGFLGLATTMCVGLYQGYLFAIGQSPPFWLVNTHAHLGVLLILAIVTGFAIDALVVIGLGVVLGFRPGAGAVGVLLALGLVLVFAFSPSWIWILVGLSVEKPSPS